MRSAALDRGTAALAVAFLLVLPFSSSVAVRNALMALVIAGLAVRAVLQAGWRPGRLPRGRILLPIALWCLWCAASVAWSLDPAYSASELRPGLLYPVAAFLVFHALTAEAADIDRWAWTLAAGLAILGVAAIVPGVRHGAWDAQRWHGGVGAFATHIVLTWPLLAWLAVRTPRDAVARRAALAIVAAIACASLWLTDNRISWVALAVMTCLWAAASWRDAARAGRARIALAATLACVAFAAAFALSLQNRSPTRQEDTVAAARELATDPRVGLWRFAAARIAEAPWLGHGYGKSILKREFVEGVKPHHPLNQHAHNTLLNVALQTGLVGAALFAWMTGALALEMAAGLRRPAPHGLAAVLGLVALSGFAIRNLTDDFLVRHNAILAAAIAGAVLGALRARGPTSARTPA